MKLREQFFRLEGVRQVWDSMDRPKIRAADDLCHQVAGGHLSNARAAVIAHARAWPRYVENARFKTWLMHGRSLR